MLAFTFKNTRTGEQWVSPHVARAALKSTYFEGMLHYYDNNNNTIVEFTDEEELGYHPMQALRVLSALQKDYVRTIPVPAALQSFFGLDARKLYIGNECIMRKVLRGFLFRYAAKKMRRYLAVSVEKSNNYECEAHHLLVRCAWTDYDEDNLPNLIHDGQVVVRNWNGSFRNGCYPSLRGGLALEFKDMRDRYVVYYFYQPRMKQNYKNLYTTGYRLHYIPDGQQHNLLEIQGGYVCRVFRDDPDTMKCRGKFCICRHYQPRNENLFNLQFLRKHDMIY